MKTRSFVYFAFIAWTVSACNKDESFNTETSLSPNETKAISMTTNGFLRFDTSNTLLNFLNQKSKRIEITRSRENEITQECEDNSVLFCLPEEFESVAELKCQLYNNEEELAEDENTDMTIDEYNVLRADQLLKDPALTEIMDTTLRIQIGDTIYKVCEYGTFSGTSLEDIETAIANFDTALITNETKNMTMPLKNGVNFTNTFGDCLDECQPT